jgi:hypothetical protein
MLCWYCLQIFFSPLVTISVAPVITDMMKHFLFHILWISVFRSLYFGFFSTSLCNAFLSDGIATSTIIFNSRYVFRIFRYTGNYQVSAKCQWYCIGVLFYEMLKNFLTIIIIIVVVVVVIIIIIIIIIIIVVVVVVVVVVGLCAFYWLRPLAYSVSEWNSETVNPFSILTGPFEWGISPS